MYEKLEECPSCKHTHFNNFLISQDIFHSQESFALVRCSKCQLVFTNPRVTSEFLSRYSFSLDLTAQSFITRKTYAHINNSFYKEQIKPLFDYSTPSVALDISVFSTTYTKHLNAKGWSIEHKPIDLHNQDTYLKELSSLKESFSNILCLNTFQNIYKPKPLLKELRKHLNTDGYIFISLPNYQSIEAKHYQGEWPGYNVPRTQFHFNQQSLSILIKSAKLNLVDVIPITTSGRYYHLLHQLASGSKMRVKQLIEKTRQSNKLAKRDTAEASMNLYVLNK